MSRMAFAGKFFVGFVFSADFAIMTVFFHRLDPFSHRAYKLRTAPMMMLEIPAGVIEEGESGEAAVLRELEEETGKRAGRAEFLCELYPSVGFCTEKIQLFFATELTAGTQKLDADEFVEIEKYTLEEAIAMIHKGEIKDGKTIAALFAWQARKNA